MQHVRRHLALLAFLVALVPVLSQAAGGATPATSGGGTTPCGPGQRLTTADDAVVKNGTLKVGTCYNPNDVGIGQGAEDAKAYLYSISTKINTADKEHIGKLNDSFAICAARFFKAYTSKYGTVQITSAWRSGADQARVSTSPTSNHTRGLAVDVHPANQNYDQLMNFAKDNPQFGVCFARPMYNGRPDLPHMTAAGIGSRTEDCSKYGITKMCDAGGAFDPNAVTYRPPSSSGATPYSQITPLGTGQTVANSAQGPCPSGYVFYNNQCYALSNSQPLGAAQQPFQPSQPMQTGQPTGIGQPSYPSTPISQGTGGTAGTPNTNTGNSPGTGSTNNLKLVEAIINGTSTATGTVVGTASTFTSDSLSSTASYGNGAPASDTLLNTSSHAATNTLTFDQLTASQGTFSTADIGTAVDITASSNGQNILRVALENLRRRLVYVLEVLGLMRRGAPAQEIQNLPLPQLIPLTPMFTEGGE